MTRDKPATRGELAIRARNKVARIRATKPENMNAEVSRRMDEVFAVRRADELIQAPENLVNACGETMQSDFRLDHVIDTLQNPNMVSVSASEFRLDLAACVWSQMAELAVDASESAKAGNSLEKMLCHQMAAMHCLAMKMATASLRTEQPVEMARLSNASARMMQVYQEAFLALQKIRTGGKQTVVVQHVQVSDGGKAVIAGNLETGGGQGDEG